MVRCPVVNYFAKSTENEERVPGETTGYSKVCVDERVDSLN